MGDIQILVDIGNSLEILKEFLKLFCEQNNWSAEPNACVDNEYWKECPNKIAKYFCIDIEDKKFSWAAHDADEKARGQYQPVNTVEDAISIAEFAIANADALMCDPLKPFVPANKNATNNSSCENTNYINIDKLKKCINKEMVISFKKNSHYDYTSVYYTHNSSWEDFYPEMDFSFKEKTAELIKKAPPVKPVSLDLENFSEYAKKLMEGVKDKLKKCSEAP